VGEEHDFFNEHLEDVPGCGIPDEVLWLRGSWLRLDGISALYVGDSNHLSEWFKWTGQGASDGLYFTHLRTLLGR